VLRAALCLTIPFLEYSVHNILRHSNSAQQNELAQGDFLGRFPRQRWIFLNNTLEQHKIRRYTPRASLLYVFAEYNLAALIGIHPSATSCFVEEDERYGPPIFAAMATRNDEATKAFLGAIAETAPAKSPLHDIWKQYPRNKRNGHGFGREFNFSRQQGVHPYIADLDNDTLVAFLLLWGKADVDPRDKKGRTPLSWAAGRGLEATVKLLLEKVLTCR
jgi:hypothetical protein